jgi:hypothetical protein
VRARARALARGGGGARGPRPSPPIVVVAATAAIAAAVPPPARPPSSSAQRSQGNAGHGLHNGRRVDNVLQGHCSFRHAAACLEPPYN